MSRSKNLGGSKRPAFSYAKCMDRTRPALPLKLSRIWIGYGAWGGRGKNRMGVLHCSRPRPEHSGDSGRKFAGFCATASYI
jgi:hypothetical protein